MTMTEVRPMPHPQWRLMNLLYRRSQPAHSRRAAAMLAYAEASLDDLKELEGREFLVVRCGNLPTPLRRVGQRLLEHESTTLNLTHSGSRWVTSNPVNCALYAVGVTGRRRRLSDVLVIHGGLGTDSVLALVKDRLVTVLDNDGEVLDRGEAAITNPRCPSSLVWLQLTPAGHSILNGG